MTSTTGSQLKDYEVLFFDVYATLCDWETGIYEALKPLLSKFRASAKWSRKEAIEAFTAIEVDLVAKSPELLYRDILAKTHEVMEERLRAASGQEVRTTTLEGDPSTVPSLSGASTSTDPPPEHTETPSPHVSFASSIKDWPLFPDTVEALRTLAKHYKLCVLSNVDHASFAHTLAKLSGDESHPELYQPPKSGYWFPQDTPNSKSPFTFILTAQDVGSYKPAPRGFETALKLAEEDPHLAGTTERGVKGRVLWVAQSLFGDIEPTSKMGLTSVFINRAGSTMGLNGAHSYSWKFETLGEMADEVSRNVAQ
ncbi:hypothetical protein V5O48_003475 [Marasmius crinis-equi]|uniref:Haloacid dehalogenase n=1 Tax=Marasmius crinis-equi TaxID=585013 RepID=A0ABR3FST7_9AGAR